MDVRNYPYLTNDHIDLMMAVRDFAKKKIAPIAEKLDAESRFPAEIVKEMAEMGLMGLAFPAEYGGAGCDDLSYALCVEEISAACASCGVIMSAHNSLACSPIYYFGTEEQRKKYLTPLLSEGKIGSFALTEANAGSDSGGTRTTYKIEGDTVVLNGVKNFITNGPQADYIVVLATKDRSLKHKGITAFIAEKKHFKVGKIEKKLGINASGTSEIIFENARLPLTSMLAGEGDGFKVAMHTLDGGRIGIAAQALGIGRAAYEFAVKYSQQRQQFDQPISNFQAIQFHLADMATRLDAARLLTHRAALVKADKESGRRLSPLSAMAKVSASEAAMWVTTKAIQVLGGYGYIKEFPVERHFRDAKITELYEGTSEIQRIVISSSILKGQYQLS